MVIIILTISIITAFAQIISTFSDLKKADPAIQGIGKVTGAGWFFYVCTVILAVLPAIQNELQKDIDDKKDKTNSTLQEQRDERLRKAYDSSLFVMKGKFDTTTSIISETLGKYGFKLDSSNKVLISIRDSAKTRVILTDNPVLTLASAPNKGIIFDGLQPDGKYKFVFEVQSMDAGSSFYDIKLSFVISKEGKLNYITMNNMVKLQAPLWKNAIGSIPVEFNDIENYEELYLWLRGTYKRIDGTGNFEINQVYSYDAKTKLVGSRGGNTKSNIINVVKSVEK